MLPGSSRMTHPWRRAALAAGLFLGADQATKQLVVHSIERNRHENVFFALDITNVRNTGLAFGTLAGNGVAVPALTIAAVVLLVVYFARRAETPHLWLPVGVVVGGALGNLADRAREGAVIDFIKPSFWPAFNLADTGIVLGVLAVLYVVEGSRQPARSG